MEATAGIPVASGLYYIDSLLGSSRWNQGYDATLELTYSFTFAYYDHTQFYAYMPNHETSYDLSGLSDAQQESARAALQEWANVADIQFTEIIDNPGASSFSATYGDLRFTYLHGGMDSSTWGYAYFPGRNIGGDIWLSSDNKYSYLGESNIFEEGGYDYFSLIHEIGHALGLKHSFDGESLPGTEDSHRYSVMSYTYADPLYLDRNKSGLAVKEVLPTGPMLYDIAAIQYLYGENTSYNASDTDYIFHPDSPFYKTIWDAGGEDTIYFTDFSTACSIDLRAGKFSSLVYESNIDASYYLTEEELSNLYTGENNLAIAYGVVIENVAAGSGNDRITGNASDNTLNGGAGDDSFIASEGEDIIIGGSGLDVLYIQSPVSEATISTSEENHRITYEDKSDFINSVERLFFTDSAIALDLGDNAGKVAKLLGAVFGPTAIENKTYAGIGLNLLDQGMSYEALAQLALNTADVTGATETVTLLYNNVVGEIPTEAEIAPYLEMLENGGYTSADLTIYAANSGLNAENIGLTGLAETGLDYTLIIS